MTQLFGVHLNITCYWNHLFIDPGPNNSNMVLFSTWHKVTFFCFAQLFFFILWWMQLPVHFQMTIWSSGFFFMISMLRGLFAFIFKINDTYTISVQNLQASVSHLKIKKNFTCQHDNIKVQIQVNKGIWKRSFWNISQEIPFQFSRSLAFL